MVSLMDEQKVEQSCRSRGGGADEGQRGKKERKKKEKRTDRTEVLARPVVALI
jgi:hypothetical protein